MLSGWCKERGTFLLQTRGATTKTMNSAAMICSMIFVFQIGRATYHRSVRCDRFFVGIFSCRSARGKSRNPHPPGRHPTGVPPVGWASRLPYFASRGIHPDTEGNRIAWGRPRGAARDARHGRRDANPTRSTPLCFSAQPVFARHNSIRKKRNLDAPSPVRPHVTQR